VSCEKSTLISPHNPKIPLFPLPYVWLINDTKGVEAISPGLPDSERATPGPNPFNPSLSRVARRAKRVSSFDRIKQGSTYVKNFANTTQEFNHAKPTSVNPDAVGKLPAPSRVACSDLAVVFRCLCIKFGKHLWLHPLLQIVATTIVNHARHARENRGPTLLRRVLKDMFKERHARGGGDVFAVGRELTLKASPCKIENPGSTFTVSFGNRVSKLTSQLEKEVVNAVLLVITRNELLMLGKSAQRQRSPVGLRLRHRLFRLFFPTDLCRATHTPNIVLGRRSQPISFHEIDGISGFLPCKEQIAALFSPHFHDFSVWNTLSASKFLLKPYRKFFFVPNL